MRRGRKFILFSSFLLAVLASTGCQMKLTHRVIVPDVIVGGAAPGENGGESNQPELPPRPIVEAPPTAQTPIRAAVFVAPTVNPAGMSTSPTLRPGD